MALTEVDTKGIKNASIKLEDIENGTSSDAGKFLKNNDGAAPSWATVSTDLVADTSPQLGGDLDTNDHEILLDDAHAVKFGAGVDLTIKSDGDNGEIATPNGDLEISAGSTTDALKVSQTAVTTKTDQLVAYSDVVVGSITSGERHYLGIAEDAANGTNTIRFYAPASLANNLTYYLELAGGSNGDVLKLNGANIEWGTAGAGAVGGSTDKIFWENGKTVTTSYTIGTSFDADCNAMSAGPITINNGVTVTINSGETWTIV